MLNARKRWTSGAGMLCLLAAAACSDSVMSPVANRSLTPGGLNRTTTQGVGVYVCKVAKQPGIYSFNVSASNTNGTLVNGPVVTVNVLTANSDPSDYCMQAWAPGSDPFAAPTDVTVAEQVPAGQQVDSILLVTTPPGNRDIFYGLTSKTVTASYSQGYLIKFFNSGTTPPPPPGSQGCTPGYWKQTQHFDSYPTGYLPTQTIGTYFPNASIFGYAGNTLVEGLGFNGGSGDAGAARILLRAAIAGLLNSASFPSGYPSTPSALMTAVNNALTGTRDDMLNLASTIDKNNNLGCPLN